EKTPFPTPAAGIPRVGGFGRPTKKPAKWLRQKKPRPSRPAHGGFPPPFTEQGYPTAVEFGIADFETRALVYGMIIYYSEAILKLELFSNLEPSICWWLLNKDSR
ncbi:MAG: hypothetical protein LBI94_03945, partial [Treponema sp.]|nr:hypothetical protein [Treponema sp.]